MVSIADTIGRVEFIVGLDGRGLSREARREAKKLSGVGDEAGDEFGQSFNRAVGPHLSKLSKTIATRLSESGKLGGRKLADDFADIALRRIRERRIDIAEALFDQHGFDNLVERIGSVDGAIDHLRTSIDALHEEHLFDDDGTWRGLVITKREVESLNGSIDLFADNLRGRLRPSIDEVSDSLDAAEKESSGLSKAIRRLTADGHKQGSMWKNLSANTRQWTLIIGAVIASMSDLAGLSSAAGSGLFVLGGALSGALTGAIFGFVAFSKFIGDIEKLPAAIVPARKAFDDFRDTFSEVMTAMSVRAFKGTEGSWKRLASVVKQLTPGFEAIGDVINDLITDLAKNIKPKTIENLNTFLTMSGEIFGRLLRVVGKVGDALLVAFASPAFQRSLEGLLSWIEELTDTFADFLKGPGFDEWLRHGEAVFGALGSLLETTGGLLNDMVTDETIGQLTDFIGHIEGFLDGGGRDLLDVAQKLDIFGLLAEALDEFGRALEPLAGPMGELAEATNEVIKSGIKILAPIIADVAEALAPFVQALADFMKEHPKEVAKGLIAIVSALVLFRAVKLGSIAVDMALFTTEMVAGGAAIKKFDVGKLKRISGGLAGLAVVTAVQIIPDEFWDQFDLDSNVSQNTLTGAGLGAMFGIWGVVIGAGIGYIYSLLTEFEGTWNDTGTRMTAALTTGPWGTFAAQVAEFFAGLIPEEWMTSDNPLEKTLATIAAPVTDPGTYITSLPKLFQTTWDNVALGMDVFKIQWAIFTATLPTMWETAWETMKNPEFWFSISTLIGTWFAQVIIGFKVWFAGLAIQWTTFWLNLPKTITTAWTLISVTIGLWWTTIQLGFVVWYGKLKTDWDSFWNGVPKKPAEAAGLIGTVLRLMWSTISLQFTLGVIGAKTKWDNFWNGLAETVSGVVNTIIGSISRLFAPISDAISGVSSIPIPGGGKLPKGATGALLTRPTALIGGEAGPEALVPLRRPLSQVDPAVRGLSAIAQGRTASTVGPSGPSKQINISEGAIQINAPDPWRAANETVNQIVERSVA